MASLKFPIVSLVSLVTLLPAGLATHDTGCVPGGADPATYTVIVSPLDGSTFYIEERGNPLGTGPPAPLSGFLPGDGTWTWAESNGVPGLQRDDRDPGTVDLEGVLCELSCVVIEDPTVDESCGHGSDDLVF